MSGLHAANRVVLPYVCFGESPSDGRRMLVRKKRMMCEVDFIKGVASRILCIDAYAWVWVHRYREKRPDNWQ